MGLLPIITVPPNAGPEAEKAARQFDVLALTTAAVAAFLVVLGALTHAGIVGRPDSFLDMMAVAGLVALGIAVPSIRQLGQVVTTTKSAEAAHKRLDRLNAPPADDGQP